MATVDVAQNDNEVTLTVNGDFTFPIHRQFLDAYKAHENSKHFLVNLNNTAYIDSAGLGMLLRLKEFAEKQQAKVTLLCASPSTYELLSLTKFDKLFSIEQTDPVN
jgi:anti-anti-sigma factor